jgi:hypothetical protein
MKNVIGPEILTKRIDYMDTKSIWFYIESINYCLKTNTVENDGSIMVTLRYNIDGDMVNTIIDFYLKAGWSDVNVKLTGNDDGLYGNTIFTFVPPRAEVIRVRRRVNKKL